VLTPVFWEEDQSEHFQVLTSELSSADLSREANFIVARKNVDFFSFAPNPMSHQKNLLTQQELCWHHSPRHTHHMHLHRHIYSSVGLFLMDGVCSSSSCSLVALFLFVCLFVCFLILLLCVLKRNYY